MLPRFIKMCLCTASPPNMGLLFVARQRQVGAEQGVGTLDLAEQRRI